MLREECTSVDGGRARCPRPATLAALPLPSSPSHDARFGETCVSGIDRRSFFRIVATSGAAMAASGCGNDARELIGAIPEKLIPYVVPPDGIVPGVASYFATVCRECPSGCGVLAKNRDGRVIKLEGNPDHPVNAGALCMRGQAALQGLYHPDRFAGPQRRDGNALKPASWDDSLKAVAEKIAAARGGASKGKSVVLVSQLESGTLGALMDTFTKSLGTRPRVT